MFPLLLGSRNTDELQLFPRSDLLVKFPKHPKIKTVRYLRADPRWCVAAVFAPHSRLEPVCPSGKSSEQPLEFQQCVQAVLAISQSIG